ncbi:Wzz/FepE/Etk N-terminal domain-containing protein [Aquifex pyrophilus]
MEEQKKNQGYYYEEDEIDLFELLEVLYKKRVIILATTLLFTLTAALASFIMPRTYKAEVYFEIVDYVYKIITSDFQRSSDIEFINVSMLKTSFESYIKSKNLGIDVNISSIKRNENLGKIEAFGYSKEEAKKNLREVIKIINNIVLKEKIKTLRELVKTKIEIIDETLKNFGKILPDKTSISENFISTLISISTQKRILKNWLENPKLIEFTSDIIVYDKPVKPKPILITSVAFVSGLFLGIFLALFKHAWENRKSRQT